MQTGAIRTVRELKAQKGNLRRDGDPPEPRTDPHHPSRPQPPRRSARSTHRERGARLPRQPRSALLPRGRRGDTGRDGRGHNPPRRRYRSRGGQAFVREGTHGGRQLGTNKIRNKASGIWNTEAVSESVNRAHALSKAHGSIRENGFQKSCPATGSEFWRTTIKPVSRCYTHASQCRSPYTRPAACGGARCETHGLRRATTQALPRFCMVNRARQPRREGSGLQSQAPTTARSIMWAVKRTKRSRQAVLHAQAILVVHLRGRQAVVHWAAIFAIPT